MQINDISLTNKEKKPINSSKIESIKKKAIETGLNTTAHGKIFKPFAS
jgi:hypothetical protein